MLEGINLECVRGDRTLFRDLSFTIEPGSLLRVAGENGSGKTSLLRIVCGLGTPESGEVRWQGRSIRTLREDFTRQLVYIAHANALKDDLSALENLLISVALAGGDARTPAMLEALDQVGVAHCAKLPARALSQGQRRRVSLARLVLSARAALWILDEPFTGLDVSAMQSLQHLIAGHIDRGGLVMLTTHQEVSIAARRSAQLDLPAEPA